MPIKEKIDEMIARLHTNADVSKANGGESSLEFGGYKAQIEALQDLQKKFENDQASDLSEILNRLYDKEEDVEIQRGMGVTETKTIVVKAPCLDLAMLGELRKSVADDYWAATILNERITQLTPVVEEVEEEEAWYQKKPAWLNATDTDGETRKLYNQLITAGKTYQEASYGLFRSQSDESKVFLAVIKEFPNAETAESFKKKAQKLLSSVDMAMGPLSDAPKTTFQQCLVRAMSSKNKNDGRLNITVAIARLESLEKKPGYVDRFIEKADQKIRLYSEGDGRGVLASVFKHYSSDANMKALIKEYTRVQGTGPGGLIDSEPSSGTKRTALFKLLDHIVARAEKGEKSAMVNCMGDLLAEYKINKDTINPSNANVLVAEGVSTSSFTKSGSKLDNTQG